MVERPQGETELIVPRTITGHISVLPVRNNNWENVDVGWRDNSAEAAWVLPLHSAAVLAAISGNSHACDACSLIVSPASRLNLVAFHRSNEQFVGHNIPYELNFVNDQMF